MFLILPWRVDVPEDRWPMMNWLIMVATVAVFAMQVNDAPKREAARHPQPGVIHPPVVRPQGGPIDPNALAPLLTHEAPPTITDTFKLKGWGLKGLFGYMWLHGGLFHLLGNMWFLWIFGNAVCAKVGNIRYLFLYVFFGVAAGVAHLFTSSAAAIGASGAINGIVGMYLVLFFENNISCYFIFWFIVPIVRQFTISSFWMILLWLFWDILGAFFLQSGSNVAHFAHLGGFAAGFGIALLMCQKGWITMERYEKSLLQMWQQRKRWRAKPAFDTIVQQLATESASDEPGQLESVPTPAAPSRPVPCLDLDSGSVIPTDNLMCMRCSCGRTITVSRQYAGKVVRCPACKGKVRIPDSIEPTHPTSGPFAPTADGRHIHFVCPCGKRVKMPARYAGRTGRCPQCGAMVRIPPRST